MLIDFPIRNLTTSSVLRKPLLYDTIGHLFLANVVEPFFA